jgi:cyclohexanecarboxylate-CoA ligase
MLAEVLPIGSSFWHLVEQRAHRTPDRVFLSDERGRILTFGQYCQYAQQVAAGLLELGVEPHDVVSWQLPTTLEAAVLMAALSRLGVRQNPILPILRRAEVALITAQVKSSWLIVPGVYRGFDFVEMATHALGGRSCSIVRTDDFVHDHHLALPLGDVSALQPPVDPGAGRALVLLLVGHHCVAKGRDPHGRLGDGFVERPNGLYRSSAG